MRHPIKMITESWGVQFQESLISEMPVATLPVIRDLTAWVVIERENYFSEYGVPRHRYYNHERFGTEAEAIERAKFRATHHLVYTGKWWDPFTWNQYVWRKNE